MNRDPDSLHSHNRAAWDVRARNGMRHSISALPKDLQNPLPVLDPEGWLGGNVTGLSVLCLASGGGLQSALFAAAGAAVTVVDLSQEMLNRDRVVAREHRLDITCVRASMEQLPIRDAAFDLVLQPVSSCYVSDIAAAYREVRRVIRPDGIYISQHKQPASLQSSIAPGPRGFELIEPYYRTGALPPTGECLHREADAIEFLHTWEQIIGQLCRSGFVIEDLIEPRQQTTHPAMALFVERSRFLPPYVKIKARALNKSAEKGGILIMGD